VNGDGAALSEAVGNVSGVADVQLVGELFDTAVVRFESARADAEVSPEVAAAVSGAGLGLVGIKASATSLEDVFRGLTGGKEN